MKRRVILMMIAVVLSFSLCGCESNQKNGDKTSGKKEMVKEKSDGAITKQPTVTKQPAATMKPVEKLDIVWLEPGIIPQESVKLKHELESGKIGETEYISHGTVIPALVYEATEQGYEIEKHGFIDENGKKIFQNTYDFIDYTENELMCAGKYYGDADYLMKFGYIDRNGEEVIAFEYDEASNFSGDLAKVGKRNEAGIIKYGYINQNGEEVIPCKYDKAENFFCDLASVAKHKEVVYNGEKYKLLRYGFIDRTGKTVIPLKYDSSEPQFMRNDFFEKPIVKVADGINYGYIDTAGKVVIPFKYSWIDHIYKEGLFRVTTKGDKEMGYLDSEGKETIPLLSLEKYAYGLFSDGLASKIKIEGESPEDWRVVEFVDRKGNVIISVKGWYPVKGWSTGMNYSHPKFVNGRVKLAKPKKSEERKWGFLDKNGTEVIPAEYDMADDFNDTTTRVGKGEKLKYGAINQNGEIVIPVQYDEMTSFTEGLSVAGKQKDDVKKYAVFDRNGKMLTEMECDEIHIINQGRYGYVRKGEKYGIFKNPYYNAS